MKRILLGLTLLTALGALSAQAEDSRLDIAKRGVIGLGGAVSVTGTDAAGGAVRGRLISPNIAFNNESFIELFNFVLEGGRSNEMAVFNLELQSRFGTRQWGIGTDYAINVPGNKDRFGQIRACVGPYAGDPTKASVSLMFTGGLLFDKQGASNFFGGELKGHLNHNKIIFEGVVGYDALVDWHKGSEAGATTTVKNEDGSYSIITPIKTQAIKSKGIGSHIMCKAATLIPLSKSVYAEGEVSVDHYEAQAVTENTSQEVSIDRTPVAVKLSINKTFGWE